MGARVLQQVAEGAAQRHRPARHQHPAGVGGREFVAEIRKVGSDAVDQRMEIDRACPFPPHVLADERQGVLRHALHLVQHREDLRPRVLVLDELGLDAQARDRCPQIVRYRRQHGRAVTHVAVEPPAHEVEGPHGAADFQGAGLRQVTHLLAPAEPTGGRREAPHGFRDAASREDRHARHAEDRQQEREQERPAPGRRARQRSHGDVQPAPVPMVTDAANQCSRQSS